MESARFVRWAAAAGVVGGVLWVIGIAVHAVKPVGCVGAQCAGRSMRESSPLEAALGLAAFLLFGLAGVALVGLARRAGRFGTSGRVGSVLAVVGVCVLIAAGLTQELLFDGDSPLMPYFVVPGIAAIVVGVVLLATTVLRSGVLPRWAALSLVIGALALLTANEQTAMAWLAVPFGLAWIAVGIALWRKKPVLQTP